MNMSESTRASVRKMLNSILKNDADLEAFCIDYLPEVKARFSSGMDRVQKTNILLELIEVSEVLKILQVAYPQKNEPSSDSSLQDTQDGENEGPGAHAATTTLSASQRQTEEYIGLLQYRAERLTAKLLDNTNIPDVLRSRFLPLFNQLHQRHIEAIREGNLIKAHEILSDIHQEASELDEILGKDARRAFYASLSGQMHAENATTIAYQYTGANTEVILRCLRQSELDPRESGSSRMYEKTVQLDYYTQISNRRKGRTFDGDRYRLVSNCSVRYGDEEIWNAIDRRTMGLVSIHVLKTRHVDQRRMDGFFLSPQKMSSLEHDGIVKVLWIERNPTTDPFYVLEAELGTSLGSLLDSNAILQVDALSVIVDSARILAYAHRHQVFHGCINENRIFVSDSRRVRIMDFCAMGDDGNSAADIYMLALIAIRILHGRKGGIWGKVPQVIKGTNVNDELKDVLLRATSEEQKRQFSSIDEFASLLSLAAHK